MAIGELKTGVENIKSGGTKKSSMYTPFFSWKDKDVKNLFFITPIGEVPEILMHQWVIKQVPGEKPRFMTFMCRKDPAWREESNDECPLCEMGLTPTIRYAALAVEVEPVANGKRITEVQLKYNTGKDKEGNDVDYPSVGVVVQGKKFFKTLVAHDQKRDISEISWEITREGAEFNNTSYIFYPIEHAPDLEDVNLPDLKDILSYYGSEEKYDNDIDEFVTVENQFDSIKDEKPSTNGVLKTDEVDNLKETLRAKVESY